MIEGNDKDCSESKIFLKNSSEKGQEVHLARTILANKQLEKLLTFSSFLTPNPNFSETADLEVVDLSETAPPHTNVSAVEPSYYNTSTEDEAVPRESLNSQLCVVRACLIVAKHVTSDGEADELNKLKQAMNTPRNVPRHNSRKSTIKRRLSRQSS